MPGSPTRVGNLLIALNKPYGVLCQFSREGDRPTLADFVDVPRVYPAGRLDADSEGLVLLTDDGALQARLSHPRHKLTKTYLVQVEGIPEESALRALRAGVKLVDFTCAPCGAVPTGEPAWLWQRDPPIRRRERIPTSWLVLELNEGKNRQVRRMTAAVRHPTLRLVRTGIGPWHLPALGLAPGQWRRIELPESLSTTSRGRR